MMHDILGDEEVEFLFNLLGLRGLVSCEKRTCLDDCCRNGIDERITRALVETELISSRRELKAAEISGLIDARVRVRNSVAYFCFTIFGRSLWINRNHIRTIIFSNVGVSSSSSSILSPW